MPTSTYIALANITLGSSASSVTFSSIPATFRDLVLVVNGSASVGQNINGYFNSDTTAANYSRVTAYGDGSTTASGSGSNAQFMSIGTSQSTITCQVMDYSATNKHKTSLSRNSTNSIAEMEAARWANTAAITSFQIATTSGTFNSGSTFALYGIAS